ncbi:MAG: 2-amino-4-hydroxy-6-hydroxymethyldihydropteridine diphosphokinase [Gemmatimonadota bacterium]
MYTVYLGLGSNLGDRVATLREAVRRLGELGRVVGLSGVYETDPVGYADQPDFLNLVVRLATVLAPEELAVATRSIERDLGRVRTFRNAPRPVDIDLLIVRHGPGSGAAGAPLVVDRPDLVIPHPRMTGRAFVLVPLLELEPGLTAPDTGRPYAEHLAALRRGSEGEETGGDPVAPGGPGVRRVMDGEELVNGSE